MKLYNTGRVISHEFSGAKGLAGRKELGRLGEDEASVYLAAEGFDVLRRNFRNRFGEVDIIAGKGRTIFFIEVKTRRSVQCGFPEESVNGPKKNKILRTALWYLNGEGRAYKNLNISFALVAIYISGNSMDIKFIEF